MTNQPYAAQRVAIVILTLLSIWYGFYLLQPPEPKPETATPVEFSAGRAFDHVQEIADTDRPLGSEGNERARQYLFRQLQELGLKPAYQEGIGVRQSSGVAGNTTNIIAKMDGADPDHTIMLLAHYDSVPNSPGAADDASGVAAVLEVLRAVQSLENPLKNNVWVLFTDGEERGLLGAELFIDEYPGWEEIDLVINLEARGSSGTSVMFETSSPNGALIPHFARATRNPVANSLSYSVYKILPNDTDLSVIKRAGLHGLNFAFVEDYLNYHTQQDNPENLTLASLQHHGSNMLDNVLYFGSYNFDLNSDSDYVYFNNPTGGLSYYPSSWSLPLAIITALLFLAYLIFLFRTQQITIGGYFVAILLFAGIIVTGALITYFGWQSIKALHPQYQWLIHGETYNHRWYLFGFSLLNIGLLSVIYSLLQNRITTHQILSGVYTLWIVTACIVAWYLPAAAYLATWPALFGLLGWMVLGADILQPVWKNTAILIIGLFPALFIIPPYVHFIQILLTTEMLAVSMLLLLLVSGLCWPLLNRIIRTRPYLYSFTIIVVGILCFIGASLSDGFDSEHKKQNSINYIYDSDTGSAYWISSDDTTDSWTKQFLGENPREGLPGGFDIFNGSEYLYSPASASGVDPPAFEVLTDSTVSDSLRHISLSLQAYEGIGMRIDWSNSTGLTRLSIMGKQVFNSALPVAHAALNRIYYSQDLADSVKLDIVYDPKSEDQTLNFTFIRQSLPVEIVADFRERADHMMPKPLSISDATLWKMVLNL